MTVPFASGLATCTTSCTVPDDPAFNAPRFQVTTPAARVPPAVAIGRASWGGSVSISVVAVSLKDPTMPYDSVLGTIPPGATGSGASPFDRVIHRAAQTEGA